MRDATESPAAPGSARPASGMTIAHNKVDLGRFGHLMRDRGGYHGAFYGRVLAEPNVSGHLLNVGCGGAPNEFEQEIARRAAQVDGVEPTAAVHDYPGLTRRWQATLEEAAIPAAAYDLAWSYNVVEHVEHARPFFEKVRSVLKPGGVFWALTPHGRHPFCAAVRLVQFLGHKQRIAARGEGVNAYPSYYRLNTASAVVRTTRDLGFASAQFYYLPCMQWDGYFPRLLRFAPWAYDFLLGTRVTRASLLIAYRLEVAR